MKLEVTSMGNIENQYQTWKYEVSLLSSKGEIVKIIAFGMSDITGDMSKLDTQTIQKLFPYYNSVALSRQEIEIVDILLGKDYFGFHPKREVAKAGTNLSIMEGEFEMCLQGSHPLLKERTSLNTLLGVVSDRGNSVQSFFEFTPTASHMLFKKPSTTV